MKFFSAAIFVALFCASAPGVFSLEKLSYKEVALATSSESVAAQLKKYDSQIKCLNKVLSKVEDENIKTVKDEATKVINEILNVDLVNCMKMDNVDEQNKCKLALVEKSVNIISETTSKIILGSDWKVVKAVYTQISKDCLNPVSVGLTLFKNGDLKLLDVLPELFEGAAGVLKDTLQSNGLNELYTENHSKLEELIANWKKCAQKNRFMKLPCHQSNGGACDKFFSEYVLKVGDINVKVADEHFSQMIKRSFVA